MVWDVGLALPLLISDSTYVYIYGNGPIGMVDAEGNAYYYVRDDLGSVTGIVDSSGTLTATYSYDAYGNLRSSTGSISNAFRYAGEWYDSDTGLDYLRARYYGPTVGRFVTRDPWKGTLNRPYSQNPYLYAENNPANLLDPAGRNTYGIGYAFSLGAAVGGSATVMIVWDDLGNRDVMWRVMVGGYAGAVASATWVREFTTAKSIYSLPSRSVHGGFTAGLGSGVGVDFISGTNPDCTDYRGVEVFLGLPPSVSMVAGADVHGGVAWGGWLRDMPDWMKWILPLVAEADPTFLQG